VNLAAWWMIFRLVFTYSPTGLAARYLKNAYSVPAFFYMHSDWKTFARKVLGFNRENQNRFIPLKSAKLKQFMIEEEQPVILFAVRISLGKGIMELPGISSARL
jgi:hypothetical protein